MPLRDTSRRLNHDRRANLYDWLVDTRANRCVPVVGDSPADSVHRMAVAYITAPPDARLDKKMIMATRYVKGFLMICWRIVLACIVRIKNTRRVHGRVDDVFSHISTVHALVLRVSNPSNINPHPLLEIVEHEGYALDFSGVMLTDLARLYVQYTGISVSNVDPNQYKDQDGVDEFQMTTLALREIPDVREMVPVSLRDDVGLIRDAALGGRLQLSNDLLRQWKQMAMDIDYVLTTRTRQTQTQVAEYDALGLLQDRTYVAKTHGYMDVTIRHLLRYSLLPDIYIAMKNDLPMVFPDEEIVRTVAVLYERSFVMTDPFP